MQGGSTGCFEPENRFLKQRCAAAATGSAGILPAKIARTLQCIRFAGGMPALPVGSLHFYANQKAVFGLNHDNQTGFS